MLFHSVFTTINTRKALNLQTVNRFRFDRSLNTRIIETMCSYGFIDSIQVEKANALARYRRFNNIAKVLRLIEVLIAVALISWSSSRLPTVFKLSGEYLYACSCYVLKQHVVFLVGNLIVVVCYVLSRHSDVGSETAGVEIVEEYRFRSTDHQKTSDVASVIESVTPLVEESPEMKQTVMEEVHETLDRDEKIKVKIESEMATETAVKRATKQIERFQRTQSVKLRRELSMKPHGELRRSVTERRRSVVAAGDGGSTPSSTVESLSNEEFRLAVEAFILERHRLLKQQTMVEES